MKPHPLLSLVLAACAGDPISWTAKIPLPEGADACPPAADLDPAELRADYCLGGEVRSVDGEAERVASLCGNDAVDPPDCVYPITLVHYDKGAVCACGRPFAIDGEARTAPVVAGGGWADAPMPDVALLDPGVRAELARAWAAIGAAEHASVASFARFTLELLAVGAPPELVRDAQRAAEDEVRHACLAFGLASAFAGTPIGPGPLRIDGVALRGDLVGLAVATAREGCVGETLSALEMAAARDAATDPAVRQVLAIIAADEARHAVLAWRTLRFAIGADTRVASAVAAVLHTAPTVSEAGSGHPAFGIPSGTQRADLVRRGWRDVVEPAARALC